MLKQISSIIGIVIFSGLTIASSAVGVQKLINRPKTVQDTKPTEKIENKSETEPVEKELNTANINTKTDFAAKNNSGSSITTASVKTSTNSQNTSNSNPCIITLWGKQYNVTSLISTHPGGNVFTCGADMTTVYQQQHGTDLTRMQPYLVSNVTTTNSGSTKTSSGTSVNTPNISSVIPNTDCIITLWGKQYNVTSLISTHPGGNVFTCGADMTTVYQQQHGTDLSRMQPYLVVGNNNPGSPTQPVVITPTQPVNNPVSGEDDHKETEPREIEHENEDSHKNEDKHENENESVNENVRLPV